PLPRRLLTHAFGHFITDRMRQSQRQIELVALRLGAVTDTGQFQLALETLMHAGHHVGDHSSDGTGQSHVMHAATRARLDGIVLDRQFDIVRQAKVQFAVLALDAHIAARNVAFDAAWQINGCFRYSGHDSSCFLAWLGPYATRPCTALRRRDLQHALPDPTSGPAKSK